MQVDRRALTLSAARLMRGCARSFRLRCVFPACAAQARRVLRQLFYMSGGDAPIRL